MFRILAIAVVTSLFLCAGCAGTSAHCTINPLTMQVTCGVDVPPSQVPVVDGTVKSFRSIDDCGNTRAIHGVSNLYGRAFIPWQQSRGLAVDRATFSLQAKAVHKDLKREAHNASVLRSYTDQRSMWSWFKGHIFHVHDHLQLLDSSLQQPVEDPLHFPAQQSAEIITNTLPDVGTDTSSGTIAPPSDRAITNSLSKRVDALEGRVGSLEGKFASIDSKLDLLLKK